MNVLILMSGSSKSFKEAGYIYPKNLVEVAGKPLVQHVMEPLLSLKSIGANFICAVKEDENRKHHTGKVLRLIESDIKVLEIPEETSGAACSALLAIDFINNDEPLLITNGDQILENVDLPGTIQQFQSQNLDAGVLVFEDVHPRWSFVKCNDAGLVIEAAEKRPISKFATAGSYYYRAGKLFVKAAMEMIKKDAHVNELFYICPTLNELILDQKRIGTCKISRSSYRSLAAPSDVKAYASNMSSNPP